MRTSYLFAAILFFESLFGLAQAQAIADPSLALAQLRKDIIAHSPEAESLGKYGVLPLTMYTGMPNISVPVYEIKMSGLDIPISLSYSYNGYKPNDVPSWAGLGWSVQGIGSIVRVVKGEVDESMSAGNRYDDYVNISSLTWSQPFLVQAGTQGVDAEPDVYIFNVGGYSGKFIMVKGRAYLFPHQQLQITPFGSGFKIIDDKGITYIFNNSESTFHKTIAGSVPVPTHLSAWYVSQIISADQKDVVNFSYTTYTYKQPDTFMDSYTIDGRNPGNTGGGTMDYKGSFTPGELNNMDGIYMNDHEALNFMWGKSMAQLNKTTDIAMTDLNSALKGAEAYNEYDYVFGKSETFTNQSNHNEAIARGYTNEKSGVSNTQDRDKQIESVLINFYTQRR